MPFSASNSISRLSVVSARAHRKSPSSLFWIADKSWGRVPSATGFDPHSGLDLATPRCRVPSMTTPPVDRAPGTPRERAEPCGPRARSAPSVNLHHVRGRCPMSTWDDVQAPTRSAKGLRQTKRSAQLPPGRARANRLRFLDKSWRSCDDPQSYAVHLTREDQLLQKLALRRRLWN